jgi:hypothetical protein
MAPRGSTGKRILDSEEMEMMNIEFGKVKKLTPLAVSETVSLHGTERLVATVPFVVYGMFRYLFLLHRRSGGGDPATQLLTDRHLLAACICWLGAIVLILA